MTIPLFALCKAENKNNAPLLTLLTAIVIGMVGVTLKKCHNVVQIIGGILLDAFLVKRFI